MLSRVELFERIRRDRRVDPQISQRKLMRRHRVSRRTVVQALAAAVPPARKRPVGGRPRVLAPVMAIVDDMLRADLTSPKKQRHTIERICQRLAVVHGCARRSWIGSPSTGYLIETGDQSYRLQSTLERRNS